MSTIDRRSLLGSEDKTIETVEEAKEAAPEPAMTSEVEADDPAQVVTPLTEEFINSMATRWPMTMHGRALAQNLPEPLMKMLEQQSDDFLRGFANGVQAVHDLCIKVLMEELHHRVIEMQRKTGAPITDNMLSNQDRIVAVTATQVEGLCFMACKTLTDRDNVDKNTN